MTPTDPLAALLSRLTENAHQESCTDCTGPVARNNHRREDHELVVYLDVALDAVRAAGVRVTGEAGLREAILSRHPDAPHKSTACEFAGYGAENACPDRAAALATPTPDPAAPDLRSSAAWLVQRWDGNRTVEPDALRADIAVLRSALRAPTPEADR